MEEDCGKFVLEMDFDSLDSVDIDEERSTEEIDQVDKIREETFEVNSTERPSEGEKLNFILEQKNKRTLKTSSNANRFNIFLQNIGDTREIQEINPQELNELLEDFFMTVKKQDLSEYEKCSQVLIDFSKKKSTLSPSYLQQLSTEQEKCSIPNLR